MVRYGEGLFIGYRGYDKTGQDVAFPFGFGLSYTDFALSELQVTTRGSVTEGTLAATVTLTVTNTGTVSGAEVVQVYVQDVESTVSRPVRELKGFTKVFCGRSVPGGIGRTGSTGLRVLVRSARPLGGRGGPFRHRRRAPFPRSAADPNHHRRRAHSRWAAEPGFQPARVDRRRNREEADRARDRQWPAGGGNGHRASCHHRQHADEHASQLRWHEPRPRGRGSGDQRLATAGRN